MSNDLDQTIPFSASWSTDQSTKREASSLISHPKRPSKARVRRLKYSSHEQKNPKKKSSVITAKIFVATLLKKSSVNT